MAPAVKPKYRTPTSTFTSSTCTVSSSTQTTDTKQSDFLKTFRQKNPRKFDALEKKCRTPSYKEETPVLDEELQALMMLIECMQKDLKQTEVLINFISDFIKKHCKLRVVFETV
uniref:Uncharacterized protein LOC111116813 n=1 Tax=Crassostrea virginica TaxID=6565 RepID=A0A8B8C744_CRAVI|nr:uncharacterized protein LOC111116813 [Crassostrea virginica]